MSAFVSWLSVSSLGAMLSPARRGVPTFGDRFSGVSAESVSEDVVPRVALGRKADGISRNRERH
jgi:hypothetical protein